MSTATHPLIGFGALAFQVRVTDYLVLDDQLHSVLAIEPTVGPQGEVLITFTLPTRQLTVGSDATVHIA